MKYRLFLFGVSLIACTTSCSKAIIDENPNPTPPKPITEEVHYDPEVQTIMFNNCITCHAGAAPSAGLRLDNYQDTKFATENGTLIERMNSTTSPMPPSGILPAEQRQIMDKWVLDGFPEN